MKSVKLGPIGAYLIRAGFFLCRRVSPKPLVCIRFIRFLANEKSAGLQDHTTSPSACNISRLLTCRVHRIPLPTFVTIAKRPSYRERDIGLNKSASTKSPSAEFLLQALDAKMVRAPGRANQSRQISLSLA